MRMIKKAVMIGNGAAVYVPKEYSGKEIVVVLPEGLDGIRKRVLSGLIEFMPNILGVYLYGSYARGEQTIESDVDILIITEEKDDKIKNLFNDIEVRVLTLDGIKSSINNFPAIIVPILRDSKSFLNPVLLDELKNLKFNFKKFNWHFQESKRIIKIIEKFVEIDEEDIAVSHVYSLIMRFRVLYMIEGLLKNKSFSNVAIKKSLLKRGLSEENYNRFYSVYQRVREDEDVNEKVDKNEIVQLIEILKEYLVEIQNETKKKIKKGN